MSSSTEARPRPRPVAIRRAPEHLRAKVLATASATPSRTRPEGRRRAALAYGLAILVSLATFEWFGGLAHGAGRPKDVTVAIAVGAVLLAIASSWIGWHRGRTLVGRSTKLLVLPPVLLPTLTLVWLTSFHAFYTEPFSRVGYRCLALSLVIGSSLLAAAVFLRRRTVLSSSRAAGASLGAAMASWSAVLVDLWCPLTNLPHVLVGHVLPLVLLTFAGAGLGGMLAPKSRDLTTPRPERS